MAIVGIFSTSKHFANAEEHSSELNCGCGGHSSADHPEADELRMEEDAHVEKLEISVFPWEKVI